MCQHISSYYTSLTHLTWAIACTHLSTLATSLMHVKISTHHFCSGHSLCVEIEIKKMKDKKTSNWRVVHFSFFCLPFVSLDVVLSCMASHKGENSLFGVNTISSLAYSKRSCVSLVELLQKDLSNPEAYSEPCQTPKIKYFAKIINAWKLLTFFVKHSIFNASQISEYVFVICCSLFGKIEMLIRLNWLQCKFTYFKIQM